MKLTWTGNFIAPWTNWSVYRGSAEEKMCRLPSTLIWGEGGNIFLPNKAKKCFVFNRHVSRSDKIADLQTCRYAGRGGL
jgi:hypothetical protein